MASVDANLLSVHLRISLALSFCLSVFIAASAHQQAGVDKSGPQTEYARYKESVARANDLAGRIHSEADANAYLAEITSLFPQELVFLRADDGRLHRLARAEYETVNDPAKLIPEKQVADVWNEYVREVGMPAETVATPAEIHNLRDKGLATAKRAWAAGTATRWNIQKGYALTPDGKVAAGCRALEALLVIHYLSDSFRFRAAREPIARGAASSDTKSEATDPRPGIYINSVPSNRTEQNYDHEHGAGAYDKLLIHLFDKLFPG
jgi:hypothetical protein